MMYTYEEVIGKIENSRRFGNLPGVEVMRQALEVLGHPEKGMRYVHVAGTNGKGSVCAFLSSILQKAGWKVGMFTSPHLICFEERIVVDGRQIAKEDVVRLGNQLLGIDFGVIPTMFDYCLMMALLYFREKKCDIAVIETGLGGRLDSTNALGTPEVSVITKIGLDHVEILGGTLAEIAAEKAGMLKKDTVLVMENQEPEAENVLLDWAGKAQVRSVHKVMPEHISKVRGLHLQIPGVHQWENASAAMLAAEQLLSPQRDWKKLCRSGLEAAVWRGRMEVLSRHPFLMADGAHNGHGARALCESLRFLYPGEKFHFLMGVMADKDYETMIDAMLPLAIDFTTVTPESSRALQAKLLAQRISRKGVKAHYADYIAQAVAALPEEGKTIAFGSLYFIGELEAMIGDAKER